MSQPLVSIIVLSYNHSHYVIETLESVKAQTYGPVELIIVDDCSTDDSFNIIEQWILNNNISCTFFRHEQNQGICKSLNHALSVAKGKYVSMIASDDIWLANKIERQVAIMETQPFHTGVLYSDAYLIDERGNALPEMFIASHRQLPEMPDGEILDVLLGGNFIPAMATLIRTACFAEVGLYDEKLSFEDWDMWLRIARSFAFFYSLEPSAKYRMHEKSFSHCDNRRILRDTLQMSLKHLGSYNLEKAQKSILAHCMLNYIQRLIRLGEPVEDILCASWKASGDSEFMRAYLKFKLEALRDSARTRLWHPFLAATRSVRHAVGIKKS